MLFNTRLDSITRAWQTSSGALQTGKVKQTALLCHRRVKHPYPTQASSKNLYTFSFRRMDLRNENRFDYLPKGNCFLLTIGALYFRDAPKNTKACSRHEQGALSSWDFLAAAASDKNLLSRQIYDLYSQCTSEFLYLKEEGCTKRFRRVPIRRTHCFTRTVTFEDDVKEIEVHYEMLFQKTTWGSRHFDSVPSGACTALPVQLPDSPIHVPSLHVRYHTSPVLLHWIFKLSPVLTIQASFGISNAGHPEAVKQTMEQDKEMRNRSSTLTGTKDMFGHFHFGCIRRNSKPTEQGRASCRWDLECKLVWNSSPPPEIVQPVNSTSDKLIAIFHIWSQNRCDEFRCNICFVLPIRPK